MSQHTSNCNDFENPEYLYQIIRDKETTHDGVLKCLLNNCRKILPKVQYQLQLIYHEDLARDEALSLLFDQILHFLSKLKNGEYNSEWKVSVMIGRATLSRAIDLTRKGGKKPPTGPYPPNGNVEDEAEDSFEEMLFEEIDSGPISSEEFNPRLLACLTKLVEKERVATIMWSRGSDLEEIANTIGETKENTSRIIYRAKLKLRKCYLST